MTILPTVGSLVAVVNDKVYFAPVRPTVKTVVLLTAEDTVKAFAVVVYDAAVDVIATKEPSDSLKKM